VVGVSVPRPLTRGEERIDRRSTSPVLLGNQVLGAEAARTKMGQGYEPSWKSRPGWKTYHGSVPPASIWPATVVSNSKALASEKSQAVPKET
jgi:hypothetical protein